ncbi:MAG: hypothetical protein EZS28_039454, partial [Streblomastix strix]
MSSRLFVGNLNFDTTAE